MAGELASEDHRDLRTFIVSAFAAITVISCFWIASRNGWPGTGWNAIGAIGAIGQAIGVLAALAYAKRQIEQTRIENERRRRQELRDRLADIFFGELKPSAHAFRSALNSFKWNFEYRENLMDDTLFDEPLDDVRKQEMVEYFDRKRGELDERLKEAGDRLVSATDRTVVAAQSLGLGRNMILRRLQIAALLAIPPSLSIMTAAEVEKQSSERIEKSVHEFETFIVAEIDRDAPS